MRIYKIDNFDKESFEDVLVCEKINEHYGQILVDTLNERNSSVSSPDYYILVDDNYKPYSLS